ncbi:phosphotransferase enzyme family protein [Oerskovia sp. KBS0722]|uniref:phosphotransferase enzyme family protein n=1 Tax=Oerskovia sp. KBS0722 TaxID=1179673 RepID=UPI00110DED1C|nr:phosphotransferase [Oerskovia sp. KBS0722]QDW61715.1 phosphotransferase [Oerskovia sp. KBS0722]
MLPLSEIRAMHQSVDDEWRSPVADVVAVRWGIAPGAARYWRSSASHVFVVPPGSDSRGVLYLRFVPATLRPRASLEVPAELLAELGTDADVVVPVPSLTGRLVETVPTPHGEVHAVVVPRAPGAEIDVDELTPTRSTAWGAALARFHLAAAPHAALVAHLSRPDHPRPRNSGNAFATLADIAAGSGDDALGAAAARLAAGWDLATAGLPSGVLHGDFELDNLRFEDDDIVAFDVDETSIGPYALDIAFAVRDLVGSHGTLDRPKRPELLSAFLKGYQQVRTLHDDERDVLSLSNAHVSARSLVHGHEVLDAGDAPDDPAWLTELRGALTEHHAQARGVVLAATAPD